MNAKTQYELIKLMLAQKPNITIGEAGRRLNKMKLQIRGAR